MRLCVIAPLLHIFLLLLQQVNRHYMLLSPPGNNQVTAVTLRHVNAVRRLLMSDFARRSFRCMLFLFINILSGTGPLDV